MATFKEHLARLIRDHGWTQLEAAKELGVSQALISHYLSGKRVPLPRTVEHIAERLGVPVNELIGDRPAQKKTKVLEPTASSGKTEMMLLAVMLRLKRRWKNKSSERDSIRHLVAILYSKDSGNILRWLEKE
jgi:transcriptional regulator with XRE-family HTH domain